MSRFVTGLVFTVVCLLTSCAQWQQLAVERDIGPLKSGDVYRIRTSPRGGPVYALTVPGVTATFAEKGSGFTRHTFVLGDQARISIYHGPNPFSVTGLNNGFNAPFGDRQTRWTVDPRKTGPVAIATLPDGPGFWQVTVTTFKTWKTSDVVTHLASFRESRKPWPEPVVPPVSHVDHMLLRGRVHCPPSHAGPRGRH